MRFAMVLGVLLAGCSAAPDGGGRADVQVDSGGSMVATQADDAGAAVGTNADGAASDADAGCQLTYPGQSFEGPPCADLGGGVYECRIDDNGLFDSIPLGSCHAVPNLIAPHCRAILVCDRD